MHLANNEKRNQTLEETYVEDEFIFYSFVVSLFSILSYYPLIFFFKKQTNSKLGTRSFDSTLVYAIMLMILFHFLSEQNCLKPWSFIPLANWHKLLNVLLLIEQCSVMLYLGRVVGYITEHTEQTLFGINIILILIFQEKDSVHGQIKYSLIPILINNAYVVYSNLA